MIRRDEVTPEEEASDLVMDIISKSKQNKSPKKAMKRLLKLTKKDLKAKSIYDNLIESVNSRLEEDK